MARVVSLYLPTWPTDRLRKTLGDTAPSSDVPLVLKGMDGRRRVIVAADDFALQTGLRVGMAVSKAQALVQELTVMDADPVADAEALEKLALWALKRYSPMVCADLPDGLIIETTGTAHLHGGEIKMVEGMIDALAGFGVTARLAIADTWGAAHALARFVARPVTVSAPGESARAILNLPVGALRLPSILVNDLRTLGFDRIGELAAQPRAPMTLRFGHDLGKRLDQALGRIHEPVDPVRPDELIEIRRVFAEPIGAPETIARYIGKLTVQLCEHLENKGLGVKRLDLLFHRTDNRIEAVRIGVAKPIRDAKRLTRLLCDKIETVDPGWGIEVMRLSATEAEPLVPRQMMSSLIEETEADVTSLIDVLANRIGADRLYRFAPVASDVPERSVKRIAATAPDVGQGWPKRWPRPTRLLSPPEVIETMALMPDYPPVSFTWRGRRRRVQAADGPERIFGEWWKRDAEISTVRDYFSIEDESGERYWIYRAGDGQDMGTGSQRWFLHGIFG